MSDLEHSAASRVAACNAVVDQLDAAAGTIQVRDGSRPDPDGALTGTVLLSFPLPAPAFGAATDDGTNASASLLGGTITVTAAAAGTAGYMAVVDNGGTTLWTGSVGAEGSGADLELSDLSPSVGQQFDLTSYTYRQPQT